MYPVYDIALTLGILLLILLVYTLPSIIAYVRKHHQLPQIIILNILLGWTIVFWLVSLFISLHKKHKAPAEQTTEQDLLNITDHTPHKHWIE